MLEVLNQIPIFLTSSFIFIFGLIFGSFGNVLIYRVPLKKNIAWPGSSCPNCKTQIKWYDNIPLFSWILLKGKCRSCSQKISFRYPMVELITGILFVLVFLKYNFSWLTLEYLIFVHLLVVVSFIDLDHMILPDIFTIGGIIFGLILGYLNPERNFLDSFYGSLLGFGFLWAIAYIYFLLRNEDGMGGGDIKLLGWIGAVLGWKSIAYVVLSSSIIGSIVGLLYAIKTKGGLKSTIPFGPYLVFGAISYLLGGDQIGNWYINFFIPSLSSLN